MTFDEEVIDAATIAAPIFTANDWVLAGSRSGEFVVPTARQLMKFLQNLVNLLREGDGTQTRSGRFRVVRVIEDDDPAFASDRIFITLELVEFDTQ